MRVDAPAEFDAERRKLKAGAVYRTKTTALLNGSFMARGSFGRGLYKRCMTVLRASVLRHRYSARNQEKFLPLKFDLWLIRGPGVRY